MFPVLNLSVKFDANIFISYRYMAIYCFADLASKCLFPPILGRFWGFDSLNVVGYCRDPQKVHPWPETRILAYRSH